MFGWVVANYHSFKIISFYWLAFVKCFYKHLVKNQHIPYKDEQYSAYLIEWPFLKVQCNKIRSDEFKCCHLGLISMMKRIGSPLYRLNCQCIHLGVYLIKINILGPLHR